MDVGTNNGRRRIISYDSLLRKSGSEPAAGRKFGKSRQVGTRHLPVVRRDGIAQGRLFDATGKVRDWWTSASAGKFKQRTVMLGKQFDSYEPLPGLHVKGDLTMGENVGDLGGLEMAWGAWRRYVAAHGDPGVKNGFTADQRFFLAYRYSWQTRRRDDTLRKQVLTNEHSPEQYRVNGIVRNFDPWYQAFDVKPGDKLYLPVEQRVHIWID